MPAPIIRNVAIIAHVDHGKTTLVDHLLMQSGMFRKGELDKLAGGQHGLIMDSNPIERERGITILSKNCAVDYHTPDGELIRINIIDTPGHADFGGEVERVLRMADGVLLLVDAFEGPMPQTRFVLSKALQAGLKPIVVINKCDRPDCRPHEVVHEVLGLLIDLNADDALLDFPVVYASARAGWASHCADTKGEDLLPIFEAIIEHVPAPGGDVNAPLQMLITTLDYSEYVGRIGIGRVFNGKMQKGMKITRLDHDGEPTSTVISALWKFEALGRIETECVNAGDLCAVVCGEQLDIGDTLADPLSPVALPPVAIDEPTLSMAFYVNNSPFSGKDGKYVTSRQIRDRLARELEKNVALRVEPGESTDEFMVSGRGLLHLSVLIETMRREGYEVAVGKPEVVTKMIDDKMYEPVERLAIECPTDQVGPVMEHVGARRGELKHMEPRGNDFTHMVFDITARGLFGLRSRLLNATQGAAIMHHRFDRYEPMSGDLPGRLNGVISATETGKVTGYALEQLAGRGVMFVEPGQDVYAGQVVGEHNRDNDIVANVVRAKHFTNVRQSTKEAYVGIKAPRKLTLEMALEYIAIDELVEITPVSIRMRKRLLDETSRRRIQRVAKARAKSEA